MNLVKAFTVLALSACTTAGVVAAASVEASTQVVAEETRTLYFKSEAGWSDNNAVIDAWVWGGSSETWVDFSRLENDDGVYTFNVPSGTTGMKLYRRSQSHPTHTHTDDDDHRWNLSGDISLDTEKDFLIHTSDWNNWTYVKLNTSQAYWTTYSEPAMIYFASEWMNEQKTYIYSYGGNKQFGDFNGTQLGNNEYVSMAKYNGKDLYAIRIPSTFTDDHLIFSNGGSGYGNQTSNLVYHPGHLYVNNSELDGYEDLGKAAAFVKELNDFRNGVQDYSICNISSSDVTSLLSEYSEVESLITNFTIYTYANKEMTSSVDVSVSDIMAQLASMQNSAASNAARLAPIMDEKKTPYYVIAVIFTLSAATVLFVGVRKRKHN